MPVHGGVPRQRAEYVGDARDAQQARGHAAHPGGPADGQVRQRTDDHADGGDRHHLLSAVMDDVGPDPDEQGVGERSREPDRGGLAVPRQVEPEHLAKRDQCAERDRDPGILQAARRGLRDRGHQPHPGGHHEQQLPGIPYPPGIPAELMSSRGQFGSLTAAAFRSETVDDAERGARVVMILGRDGGQVVGREHGRLGPLPALALERGHESVHEGRVELRARPLP